MFELFKFVKKAVVLHQNGRKAQETSRFFSSLEWKVGPFLQGMQQKETLHAFSYIQILYYSFTMDDTAKTGAYFRTFYHDSLLPYLCYLLTNWLAYLYGRIQSPRPDVMPDRREGITRAAGFGFTCIDTQAS